MPTVEEGLQESASQVAPEAEDDEGEELAETQAADTGGVSLDEIAERTSGGDGEAQEEEPSTFSLDELTQQVGAGEQEETVGEENVPINQQLLSAVEQRETGGVPEEERDVVRGESGEVGRTQVQPETATSPGFDVEPVAEDPEEAESMLEDPETNLDFSQRYLEGLKEEFDNTRDALMAYNWGPQKMQEVIESGDRSEIPNEVEEYADEVLRNSTRGQENIEEATGASLDENNIQSQADELQQPEQRLQADAGLADSEDAQSFFKAGKEAIEAGGRMLFNAPIDFVTSAAEGVAESGAGRAIEAGGRGLEFAERAVDLAGEKIMDVAEASFTPEGVSADERMEFEDSYADEAIDAVLENAAESTLSYAETFQQQPSEIDVTEAGWDLLSPENLGRVVGEQGPLALGMIGAVLANPTIGTAAIGAVEGGDYLNRLDQIEQANPEADLSEGEKLLGAAGVGTVNMMLERTGIDRIIKSARVPGLKSKILNVMMSSAAEGGTEFGQEMSQVVAEDIQIEDKSARESLQGLEPRDWQRMLHGAYGGAVIGTGFGATGASIESMIQKSRPDADLVDVQFDDEGRPEPVFSPRGHTDLSNRNDVSLQELEENDLKPPAYRTQLLREDWRRQERQSLDEERFESEKELNRHVDRVVNAGMILLDQHAADKGVELETYLEENKVSPHRGGIVTEDILNQFAGTKADMLKTERRALERAKELDEQGFDRETIRETTGWFRNPNDDMWRMEVPAETMEFQRVAETEGTRSIEDIVGTDHKIFELYPELENIDVDMSPGRGGAFNANQDNPQEVGEIGVGLDGQWKKTFWHELQHAIQYIEGFSRGASARDRSLLQDASSEANRLVSEINRLEERQAELVAEEVTEETKAQAREIDQQLTNLKEQLAGIFDKDSVSEATRAAYRNVAGEIEARVAATRNMMRRQGREPGAQIEDTFGSARLLESGPESPIEALEEEASESLPVITRLYDNPVRSKLEREGRSPLLQDDPVKSEGRGAFQPTRDGRKLIQLMENADESTIPHELMHLFRRTLSPEEDAQLKEEMGIEEWTRENEERFAKGFERFLAEEEGEAPSAELQEVFDNYAEWMENVYGQIQGSPIDVEISDGVKDFMINMFKRRVSTENKRSYLDKIAGWFNIESRFAKIGQEQTGRFIKGHQTFVDMQLNRGKALVNEVARTVESEQGVVGGLLDQAKAAIRGDDTNTEFRQKMTDVVLAAESDQVYENSPSDVQEGADLVRNYFDQAQEQYQQYGRINIGFHERLAQRLRNELERLEEEEGLSDEEVQERNELISQLEKTEDLNFVHIPVDAWFGPIAESKPGALKRILSIMADRQRETVSIQDMIEDPEVPLERGDIKIEDVILSYASQLGNDLSLLRIREAAKREGAAVEGTDDRLNNPPREAVAFQDHQVNAPLNSWLNSMIHPNTRGRVKEIINLSKMLAFWNPLFLPMYDVLQGATLGATGPIETLKATAVGAGRAAGITDKETAMISAWKDVMNQREEFWRADKFGLSSQPFSSPMQQSRREYRQEYLAGKNPVIGRVLERMEFIENGTPESQIAENTEGDVTQGRRDLLSRNKFTRLAAVPYQLSWDTAWFMDRLVRQVTYRHLKDNEGLDAQEAAQQAAEAHGDYASVPQETRDKLNSIFFTPTFKIAMGKFLGNSLRGVGEVITGRENATSRMRAGVVVKSVGILTAFDALMQSLGYEREEFGRKYCRPTDKTRAPKELCQSWSAPINLFSKYMTRVWRSFNEPTNFNAVSSLADSFRWELNPLWRVSSEIMNNRKASGGSIHHELDPPFEKNLKRIKYAGTQLFALLGQFTDNQFGKKGQEIVAEEMGRWGSLLNRFFLFAHTRDPQELRQQQQIETLWQTMQREVGATQVRQMLLRGAEPKEIENFMEGIPERQEQFMKRFDKILEQTERRTADSAFSESPDPPPRSDSTVSLEEAARMTTQ